MDDDKTVEGAMTEIGKDGKIYCCWAGKKGIYFNTSSNKGASWGRKEKVIENRETIALLLQSQVKSGYTVSNENQALQAISQH